MRPAFFFISTFFAALAILGVVLAAKGTVGAADDPLQPEESSASGGRKFDPAGKDSPSEAGFDIGDDIPRGQEFLKGKIAGSLVSVEKRRIVAGRKGRRRAKIIVQRTVKPNFLLAVEDLEERKIREVLVCADGRVTEGFEVRMVRRNGVGSRFEIAYPENMVILALRTTVRAGQNSFREVVYTPYSPQIDTPQVRQAGLKYLMTQIELAREDLERRQPGYTDLNGC